MRVSRKSVYMVAVMIAAMFAVNARADITLMMRDVIGGGTDTQVGSSTEADTIIALPAPNATYNFVDYVDVRNVVDVPSGGQFPVNDPYPDGTTGTGKSDFVLKATANIRIPAGDWTIGFARDDGGALTMGAGFPNFITEYSTNGDADPNDNVLRKNSTGGHSWTWGTFTLASSLDTTIQVVMYERGGGDSLEIAFAPGHQATFSTATWDLLEDGVNGWVVQVAPLIDTNAPAIDSLFPADDATDVNPATDMVVTFDEDIEVVTNGTISIKNLDNATQVDITLPDPQVTVSGAQLTINPTADLGFGTNYAVQISADAVQDTWVTNNVFPGILNDTNWNFTTAPLDATPPVITNTVPADDATGVVPSATLVAMFDEGIATASGNITIYNVTDATNLTTIAITDASQVTIVDNVLTVVPDVSLPGGKEVAVQIDATAIVNFSGLPFAGISDTTTWSFFVTADAYFITSANQVGNDTWSQGGNWDIGMQPAGVLSGTIMEGLQARADSNDAVPYSGGLNMQTNASLMIGGSGSTQNRLESVNAVGTGPVTMDTGSTLHWRIKSNLNVPPLTLLGDATIQLASNESHARHFTFGEISGPGKLTFLGVNNGDHKFDGTSTNWTGGFVAGISASRRTRFEGRALHCFGTGPVTLEEYTDLILQGAAGGDAIDDAATLYVNGEGRDQSPTMKLTLNGNETVFNLVRDGALYPAGDYTAANTPWISGGNTLTVLSPSDTTPPTFGSFTNDVANGPISELTHFFNYTVSFQENYVMNGATIDASDFSNTGTAAVAFGAITMVSETDVNIPVYPESGGTIQLQINAGADIQDIAGFALDTTTAIVDPTIITVTPFAPAPDGPRMVPTFDASTAFNRGGSPISGTFDARGSDKLVVVVTGEHGNPGSMAGNCISVTYDGTNLTRVVDRNPIPSAPSAAFDQTYNDIWYLDNPGDVYTAGSLVATVSSRGNVTAFALSGTAPGVGATAISPQELKWVKLGTEYSASIVIASHGMGGNGNSANVNNVDTVAPLIETSAQENGSIWDGHVTGYMTVESQGIVLPTFTGGNIVGTHTIAAEFPGAELPGAGGTMIMIK